MAVIVFSKDDTSEDNARKLFGELVYDLVEGRRADPDTYTDQYCGAEILKFLLAQNAKIERADGTLVSLPSTHRVQVHFDEDVNRTVVVIPHREPKPGDPDWQDALTLGDYFMKRCR